MLSNTNQHVPDWPASILVVGCGLLGTSFALAVQSIHPHIAIDGVEVNPIHLRDATAKQVFRQITPELPNGRYDLGVLAVPMNVACDRLSELSSIAEVVMDICSAKGDICSEAERMSLRHQFAPTHPMAGLASEGPKDATADLFRGQPWLLIEGWPACGRLEPILASLGARVVTMRSANDHDVAMAAVSHGVHLTSLAAMLAFADAEADTGLCFANVTGPGFRDVTRLSASPPDFWVSTLIGNREPVMEQITRVTRRLEAFRSALEGGDQQELRRLLLSARAAHAGWKDKHNLPSST